MRKKRLSKLLFGIFVVLIFLPMTAPGCFAKNESTGWTLDQYCESLGTVKVFLTDKAIKILNRQIGTVVLCTVASGKVCQYNPRTKRQLICDAPKFSPLNTRLAALSMGVKFSSMPMERKGNGSVLNMPTAVFCYGKSVKRFPDQARFDRYKAIEGLVTAKYQITQSFKVPKLLANVQSRFYGVPELDLIPLEMTYSDVEGRKPTYLNTLSCRQTVFKDEEFAMPKGYTSVANQAELSVQKSEAGNISDILDMTRGK